MRDSTVTRVLVTGGAGFLGSHLCDRLLALGRDVLCVDNLYTGAKANVAHLLAQPGFELMRHDVTFPLFVEVDEIFNLACPASPVHYQHAPVQTTKTSVHGAINMLGLAKRLRARIFQASTSEVYGDPEVHPQSESYWGRVNPIGPRSCYDEGKRCAETLFFDYHRQHRLPIKVARIFNTYGPRMHPNDGRVVSNFIVQALTGQPLTLYGSGSQTRSFCYVDDLIEAIVRMMATPEEVTGPINLGNAAEFTIAELAELIISLTGTKSPLIHKPLPADDPRERCPDTTLAEKQLGWKAQTPLAEGLKRTIEYFDVLLAQRGADRGSRQPDRFAVNGWPNEVHKPADSLPASPAAPRVGVVALVPDRWRGIWMPRHQVLHRLGSYFEVIWIEAPRPWREYWGQIRHDEVVIQNVVPEHSGFTVYDSGRWLPEFYRPHWLRDLIRNARLNVAVRMLHKRGCTKIVLYLWRPEFAWALDATQADLTCYHIDDEYGFATSDKPNDPREVNLIRRVDQVFIHSRRLLQKKGGINRNTEYVPNGVDYQAFCAPTAEPADLAAIPRPRMGYVGVLKAQLDLELMTELARRNPAWSFVAVGPRGFLGDKAAQLERLSALPNVHLLGNRPMRALPGYVQHMDVCMMCYEINDYTNFIYPLKLHEYLASGRPIVATPIDAVLPFADVVRVATTVEEWQAALADSLAAPANTADAVQARRARAAEHDWDLLVARIAARLRAGLQGAAPRTLPRSQTATELEP